MCQLKSMVEAREAKTAPPLGPLLAQFQLDMMKVCKELNELTKDYEAGVPLPVKIEIDRSKNYQIFLGGPTLQFLWDQLTAEVEKMDFLRFYDWVRLYCYYHGKPIDKEVVSQLLSVLSSMNRPKIQEDAEFKE